MLRPTITALICVFGFFGSGCAFETTSDDPGASAGALSDPRCLSSLHAILEDSTTSDVVGEVQFRLEPAGDGSGDALITYDGTLVTTDPDFVYTSLGLSIRSRLDDQGSIFDDYLKPEAGLPTSQIVQFGRVGIVDGALASALVDTPTDFRAVVAVQGVTGGKEAEGLVAPDRSAPESLHDRPRCF